MRAWWQRHTGQPFDNRPFSQLPAGVLLLEFYRTQAQILVRLETLEKKRGLERDDQKELARLRDILGPSVDPSPLETAWRKRRTWAGEDPVFQQWVESIETRNIPASWYGPKLRAKMEAKKAKAVKRARE